MSTQPVNIGEGTSNFEQEGGRSDFQPEEEPHMLPPQVSGGYQPLNIGQILETTIQGPNVSGGTFEIVRKLGWGAYSSVWLARSTGCANINTRYQAVKVLTLAATIGILDEIFPENQNLIAVTRTKSDHPGYHHCSILMGSMLAKSKIGLHFCFVFEPTGNDLRALQQQQPDRVFPLSTTKRIIKQTLLALDYIHTECGLVHTDLKPSNVLVSLGNHAGEKVDQKIDAYLQQNPSKMYEPRVEPTIAPEPIVTVKTQPLPNFGLNSDLSNIRIQLADYGAARTFDQCEAGMDVQPFALRAPEVMLGHTWSTPVDIWSLGCLVFEYLVETGLFQNNETPGDRAYTDIHLGQIAELLGPFPETFLDNCSFRAEYFDDGGSLLRVPKLFPGTIERRLADYSRLMPDEIGPAANFIRRCLTIDPSTRLTAKELLQDTWFCGV